MPPKKQKKVADSTIVETPVIFFLRITEPTMKIAPAGENVEYSEILQTMETSKVSERFNIGVLREILEKSTHSYSDQTACFWCCHTFNWVPSIIPISYDSYKNQYLTEGHFCSPECALAHIYSNNKLTDSTKWYRHALLNKIYSSLYTEKLLSPSLPRTSLRLFGGPLDIEQFRTHISTGNEIVISTIYPVRHVSPAMSVQGPLRDVKSYVSLTKDAIENASEHLRLKRKNPAKSSVLTLDMCIK
jgi:hypothetical protein